MISFALTEEQESIRSTVRDFAQQVMRPLARPCDEESNVPEDFLERAWQLGLTAAQLPERYGGYGAARSPVTNAVVLEELAWGDASLALAAAAPSLFAYAVADHGTEAQKEALLPAFAGGTYHTGSIALCEPHARFHPRHLRTSATPADGGFTLSGRKVAVPMGDRATHFLVIAALGDAMEAFIVPRDAEGLTVRAPEKNLGLKPLPMATLELDGVRVADADRLGGGAAAVARIVDASRVALAAVLTGLSRAVLEYCIPYTKERVAFDEPIARKQSIAFRLAEMHMEIECQRWLTWKAASELERGVDATRSAALARSYAAEKAMWISDNGVQIFGGHGFIREHPLEMWYRNTRTLGVLEGVATV